MQTKILPLMGNKLEPKLNLSKVTNTVSTGRPEDIDEK